MFRIGFDGAMSYFFWLKLLLRELNDVKTFQHK